MGVPVVTRAELRAAIERGISHAAFLRSDDEQALRRVADTADMVAVGEFRVGSCGCPLVQARIAESNGRGWHVPDRALGFYTGYDNAMRGVIGTDNEAEVVEVVA